MYQQRLVRLVVIKCYVLSSTRMKSFYMAGWVQKNRAKQQQQQKNIVEGSILFTNGQVWQPSTEWQPELTQQDGREKKTANLP